jgi:hypothetical protein
MPVTASSARSSSARQTACRWACFGSAGTSAAAASGTTNINGQELTDQEIATNLGNNLPPAGFFSLNPFKKGSIPQKILKDFFE